VSVTSGKCQEQSIENKGLQSITDTPDTPDTILANKKQKTFF